MTKQPSSRSSLRRDITIPKTLLGVLICFVLLKACETTVSFSNINLASYTLNSLTTGFKINGGGNFGNIVGANGDFDNDGFPDIIVGASTTVYVIYGGGRSSIPNSLLTTALDPQTTGFRITQGFSGSGFGYSAASFAGDINGDGFDDIIIGQSDSSDGTAYVVYGKARSSMSNINVNLLNPATTGFIIYGPPDVYFASRVSSVGDINKDGYDDVIIQSSPFTGPTVYVIYGGKNIAMQHIYLDTTPLDPKTTGFTIKSSVPSRLRSVSLSERAIDIDKDGYIDIIFSSTDISDLNSQKPVAFVIYGREKSSMSNIDLAALNPATTGFKITAGYGYDSYVNPFSVGTAGDVDKDGYDDIILGDEFADGVKGAVYVLYGKQRSSMSNVDLSTPLDPLTTGLMIKGTTDNRIGHSVSITADINKDGYHEIIFSTGTSYNAKRVVSVMYGGERSNLYNFDFLTKVLEPTLTGFTITEEGVGDGFGESITSGDIDNDGYQELIISAYMKPAVYVLYACSTCWGCPAHCDQCDSETVCTECTNPYVLNEAKCIASCPDGFFSSTKKCEGCAPGCSSCTSKLSCQLCDDGYSMTSSLVCVPSSTNPTSPTSPNSPNSPSTPSPSSSASDSPKEAQEKASQAVSSAAKGVGSVLCVGSATVPMTALVSKTVQNTRYLNLSVTYELAEIYKTWNTDMISWQVPDVFPDQDNFKTSPSLFARYDIGSPFLVNFWPTLMNIGVGFTAFITCLVLQKLLEQAKYEGWGYSLIQKFVAGSFNFALVQTYACLDDILFYLVLDCKTNPFKGFFSWASFISAIIFLSLGCLLVFFNFWTVKKYQDTKKNKRALEAFNERNKYWELFYSDFNDDDLFSQSFFAILIIRSTLSSFIITVLYEYPLMQTVYLVILDGVAIMFLYFKAPFTMLRGKLAQYYYEIITLLVHICTFILALQDTFQTPSDILRTIMCTAMLYLNTALVGGGLGFMFIEIYKSISQKSRAAKHRERKTIPKDQDQEIQNLTLKIGPSHSSGIKARRGQDPIHQEQTLSIENFDSLPAGHHNNTSISALNMDNSHLLESNFNKDNSMLSDLNLRSRNNRQKGNSILPNVMRRKPRNPNQRQQRNKSKINNTRNARPFENA